MNTISILIADDQLLIRDGLKHRLEQASHIRVVGEAENGAQLLDLVWRLQPDVLLLDIRMPVMDGHEVITKLKEHACPSGIIVMSQYNQARFIRGMAAAGVLGFLDKDSGPAELITAIEAVHQRQTFYGKGIARKLEEWESRFRRKNGQPEFSRREVEVMVLLCAGKINKEIAAKLDISQRTVEKLRLSLYEKIGVENSQGVLLFALEYGFYEP